jgi:hypothetical protein
MVCARRFWKVDIKCLGSDVLRHMHEPQLKYPTLENQPPMHGKWSHPAVPVLTLAVSSG